MPAVHFQCGHCSKLMAVSHEHLGKQVRCPHCQQVVVAPSPQPPESTAVEAPPPPLPETILHTPTSGADPEDIFSPAEASEDLFGQPPPPRLEMPPDPFATTLVTNDAGRPPQPETTLDSTLPFLSSQSPSEPPGQDDTTALLPASGNEPSWLSGTHTETMPPPASNEPPPPLFTTQPAPILEAPSESASIPRPARRTEARVPWFLILVFVPLLLYSIIISIFAYRIYQIAEERGDQLRKRFEMMPDEGDSPGVQKGKRLTRYKYDPKATTQPLPDQLCTTLGQPLTIGDLQVTPRRVERQRVRVVVEKYKPEPCLSDSLVLYLDMKNLSADYAFAPLDNYFDQHWSSGEPFPPFTLLEVGEKHFYGGPAAWHPRGDLKNKREWVEGRNDLPDVLQPGEDKEFFVCTDGNDPRAVAVLFGANAQNAYHGALLWRIRVRRGLVHVIDKDFPATAVIGVRFSDKDIHNARAEAP